MDKVFGGRSRSKDLEPVAHIKDLVHFAGIGAGSFLNDPEDGRRVEQVVLDDQEVPRQVFHTLGLAASTAMYKSMNIIEFLDQETL